MTKEEVEQIVRQVFDEAFPPYYRTVTRQYWDRNAEGAFSDPPDESVIKGITDKVFEYTDKMIGEESSGV